jgi:phage tail-like protein
MEVTGSISSLAGGSKFYPPVGFHFDVRILDAYDAVGMATGALGATASVDGSFQEVSGISTEIKTKELYEGGENRFAYKLPEAISYSPLQLKRGLVSSLSALGEWCTETFENGFDQPIVTKPVMVSLLDESNLPLMSWVFLGAYPTKWSVSTFNAQNNEIVVESLELTYRRFELINI